MSIESLNDDERVCLLGMIKLVVVADGQFAPRVAVWLRELSREMGEARFASALEAAQARFATEASVLDAVQSLARPEAWPALEAMLLEVAACADDADAAERALATLRQARRVG